MVEPQAYPHHMNEEPLTQLQIQQSEHLQIINLDILKKISLFNQDNSFVVKSHSNEFREGNLQLQLNVPHIQTPNSEEEIDSQQNSLFEETEQTFFLQILDQSDPFVKSNSQEYLKSNENFPIPFKVKSNFLKICCKSYIEFPITLKDSFENSFVYLEGVIVILYNYENLINIYNFLQDNQTTQQQISHAIYQILEVVNTLSQNYQAALLNLSIYSIFVNVETQKVIFTNIIVPIINDENQITFGFSEQKEFIPPEIRNKEQIFNISQANVYSIGTILYCGIFKRFPQENHQALFTLKGEPIHLLTITQLVQRIASVIVIDGRQINTSALFRKVLFIADIMLKQKPEERPNIESAFNALQEYFQMFE